MMRRISGWPAMAGLALVVALAAPPGVAAQAAAGNPERTGRVEFAAVDDWLIEGAVPGALRCDVGEPTGNPMQPCPPGSGVHIRGTQAFAVFTATDPRLTGPVSFTSNTDLDADYTGEFWGKLNLKVDACEGTWEGTWWGRRYKLPLPGLLGMGTWIGDLQIVARGRGCVAGLMMSAHEIPRTYTPGPLPYEVFCPTCGAEGPLTGWIVRLGR